MITVKKQMAKGPATVVATELTDEETIAALKAEILRLRSAENTELSMLRNNARIHDNNRATYEKNQSIIREQVVELQAKLLTSQNRVSELQDKLLSLRAIINAT